MLIQRGSTGTQVRKLQQELKAAGCSPGPVDGIFGPKTLAAVKAYQAKNNLAVDGMVGPRTWKALADDRFEPAKQTGPQPKPTAGATPTAPSGTAKGTNAATEAEKYLGQRESQLQAKGVTRSGVNTSESCANFVTSMLKKTGAINFHADRVSDLNTMLRDRGWHQVSLKDAKPGDVWICNKKNGEQHTELVASNNNGKVTLVGSNNHPNPKDQTVTYDATSASISGSFILAPP
jgi:Putative peptidoglycan binding domain